jgi:hypothetical protein
MCKLSTRLSVRSWQESFTFAYRTFHCICVTCFWTSLYHINDFIFTFCNNINEGCFCKKYYVAMLVPATTEILKRRQFKTKWEHYILRHRTHNIKVCSCNMLKVPSNLLNLMHFGFTWITLYNHKHGWVVRNRTIMNVSPAWLTFMRVAVEAGGSILVGELRDGFWAENWHSWRGEETTWRRSWELTDCGQE